MLNNLYQSLQASSPAAVTVVAVALMLFLGFAMTRLTKRCRLPNVTAYLLTGILIGPYVLDLIPAEVAAGMDFIADIALAFIAFGIGQFFRFSSLRRSGARSALIMLCESTLAVAAVFLLTYPILRLPLAIALPLSALAAVTAPASTAMTIRQTGARGDFVDTLLQTIALGDVFGLLAFSVALSLALATAGGGSVDLESVLLPLLKNLAVLLLGALFGVLLKLLMPGGRSNDNRLIISISLLFAFCGICSAFGVSPLLGCMSMGTLYINITEDEKLFKQLNYFSPPILLLFFVRSGVTMNLGALFGGSGGTPLLPAALLYAAVRVLAKYGGAFLGCVVAKKPKTTRNYLGLALIPQAGVAIGLATLASRALGGAGGEELQALILMSSILYEIIGPACAKLALFLSGAIPRSLEEAVPVDPLTTEGTPKTPVELLIERIKRIRVELPPTIGEEEAAFNEAALEYDDPRDLPMRYRRFRGRK